MLAPSYKRKNIKRQRGISLSRISSLHKINPTQPINTNLTHQFNHSFQSYQPTSLIHHSTQLNDNVLKQKNFNTSTQIPDNKYQSYRQPKQNISRLSHIRNRSLLQNSSKQNLNQSFNPSQSLYHQVQSFNQMIDLLKQYQKTCQQKMDLQSAQQARKRINQLKIQSLNTRRKQLQVQGKQYVIKTKRQGQMQKKQFYEFWDQKISQARKALKQIQQKYIIQQTKEYNQFYSCLNSQSDPPVKYSSKVLQIRRNLASLIKSRKYKQAQNLKQILIKRQLEQQQKWKQSIQQKKIHKLEQYKKKQLVELKAFRVKLSSSQNELLKQREKQEQRMLKRIKKLEVDAMKVPSSIIKAKNQLLNESKARVEYAQY